MRPRTTLGAAALLAAVVCLVPGSAGAAPASPFASSPVANSPAAGPPALPQVEGEQSAPVMLVLDASGSMNENLPGGSTRIQEARTAIGDLVDHAPAGAQLGLTVYGTGQSGSTTDRADGCRDVTVLNPPGTVDAAAVKAKAAAIRPAGWTPVGPALQKAADALPKEGPRSVVLVSDGEDTCAPPDPCEVARKLQSSGLDLRVHTIGLAADDATRRQLLCIAQASGGSYADAPDAASLNNELTRITGQALRGYQPSGRPVTGGPDPARAPMLTPGTYLDQVDAHAVKYYAVDVPDGYTAYASATTIAPNSGVERVELKQLDAGNTMCDVSTESSTDRGTKVVPSALRWTADGSDECHAPGRTVFAVTRTGQGPPAPTELTVLLEPGVSNAGLPAGQPATYHDPGGAPRGVVGGGSFATAAELPGAGHYTDTVAATEWVFYKVRLEWGQSLAHQVRIGGGPGRFYPRAYLFSPTREPIASEAWAVTTTEEQVYRDNSPDAPVTRPIRYRNRETDGAADYMPGWYYIAVHATEPSQGRRTVSLDVSISGNRETGPTYTAPSGIVETAPAPGPNGAAGGAPAPSGSATVLSPDDTASTHENSGVQGWVWITIGVVALVLVGGAGWVFRRRSTSSTG